MQFKTIAVAVLSLALSVSAGGYKNPPCIPQNGSKSSTCKSLSNGGLVNINLFGCSSGDFSPVINLKKRAIGETEVQILEERGGSQPKMVCWGNSPSQQSTYCKSASNAGLVNLNLFGCSSNDFSPVINL